MQPSPQRLKRGASLIKLLPAFIKSNGLMRRKKNICTSVDGSMAKDVMTLVCEALSKPMMDRSTFEKDVIAKLLEGIDSVADVRDKLTDEAMVSLGDGCHLQEYEPLQTVCRYGDASDAVYYVLQGEIAVTSLIQSKYLKDQIDSTNLLNKVRPRMLFGEAGVLSKTGRTANCVCLEKTKLVVINARYYAESVGKEIMMNRQKKVGFLSKVALFETWDYPKLVGFYESIIRNKLSPAYGTHLVKPGKHEGKIFVIFKGQVEVGIFEGKQTAAEAEQPISSRIVLLKKGEGKGKFRPLMLLEESSYFGDENNPQTNPKQQLGARVVSYDCQVYSIDRSLLMMNMFKMAFESKILDSRLADRNRQLLKLAIDSRSIKNDMKKKNCIKEGYKGWEHLVPSLSEDGQADSQRIDMRAKSFLVTHSRISPLKFGAKRSNLSPGKVVVGSKNRKRSDSDNLKEILWFDDGSRSKRLKGLNNQPNLIFRSKRSKINEQEQLNCSKENESMRNGISFAEFCRKKLALKKTAIDCLSHRIHINRPDFFISSKDNNDKTFQSLRLKSTSQLSSSPFLADGYSVINSSSLMKISQAGSVINLTSMTLENRL